MLILNKEKTQFRVSDIIQVTEKAAQVTRSVKKLNVYFDTSLATENRINETFGAYYWHIRTIGRIISTLRQMLAKHWHTPR